MEELGAVSRLTPQAHIRKSDQCNQSRVCILEGIFLRSIFFLLGVHVKNPVAVLGTLVGEINWAVWHHLVDQCFLLRVSMDLSKEQRRPRQMVPCGENDLSSQWPGPVGKENQTQNEADADGWFCVNILWQYMVSFTLWFLYLQCFFVCF